MAKKMETIKIAQYLVSKNKKTKYLKFGYGPKADKKTKEMVDAIVKALGTDMVFVNLYDEAFREKHNIQDFVKGGISVPVGENAKGQTEGSKDDTGGVDY